MAKPNLRTSSNNSFVISPRRYAMTAFSQPKYLQDSSRLTLLQFPVPNDTPYIMIGAGNCRCVSVRYFHTPGWHNLCINAYHLSINRACHPDLPFVIIQSP